MPRDVAGPEMRATTLEVVWHDKQPVLSVDFHPDGTLATAGADREIRLWQVRGPVRSHAKRRPARDCDTCTLIAPPRRRLMLMASVHFNVCLFLPPHRRRADFPDAHLLFFCTTIQ